MNPAIDEFQNAVAAKAPESYYDQGKGTYLLLDGNNEWMALNETQFKRVLKAAGLSNRTKEGETVSPQDQAILAVQRDRNVHLAGPLAGFESGYHCIGASRILVTTSPRIIEPKQGDWSLLRAVLEGLFGESDEVQVLHFLGWVKVAFEALRAGQTRPGQALVLCGPHNCGKSLLQNLLTEILGGRAAKPYQAMTGGTAFNADLFGAEHLMVEDEQPSTEIRARRSFGSQIKAITVNEAQRLHAKYRDGIILRPFWRLSVSLNDEPEALMVLPPLDDSLEDKLILLKAYRSKMPMPTTTVAERKAFWDRLISELPGFLDYLTHWQIPESMSCARFGVRHYHHPDLTDALNSLSPEARLMTLIDSVYFAENVTDSGVKQKTREYVEGTAEVLEQVLTDPSSLCAYEARRLLSWNNACGTFLGRLAKQHPDRVQQVRSAQRRAWRISRPIHGDHDAMTACL